MTFLFDLAVGDSVLTPCRMRSLRSSMSIAFIHMVGVILLGCGCAGLLLVRFDNPRLIGLGWLGAALGTGCMGNLFFLLNGRALPLLSILLADLLVLLSLVLLHFALMEVIRRRGVPAISVVLLMLQAAGDLHEIYAHPAPHYRIALVGFLAATQATYTMSFLLRNAEHAIRSPAYFISLVLASFITWNLICSLTAASGFLASRGIDGQVQVLTNLLYSAVALGLAFGFFWMTTAGLTAKLEELASTDPLTGVLNRRAFKERLEEEFGRSERLSRSFAFLMLDLDHFKQVNDQFGHLAGDEVLCNATNNIQDAIRGIDVVGRWGGEEFAILLPGANLAAAHIVARRILANIQRAAPMRDQSGYIPVTASIGLAAHCGPAACSGKNSTETITLRADAALYRAKAAGRNCVRGDQLSESSIVGPQAPSSQSGLESFPCVSM